MLTIVATVLESNEETIEVTNCNVVTVNGIEYNNSGIYTQNLTNAAGCDSTLTIVATVLESTDEILNVTVCNEFTINDETFTETGVYVQNFINNAGCDSTLTINLTVQDLIAPEVVCKDTVAQLNENGIFALTADDINNGSTDNCTIDTMYLDKYEFSCDDLGENQVTLTLLMPMEMKTAALQKW